MKIYEKLIQKYGSPPKTVMLPPPPDSDEGIPSTFDASFRTEKVSPFLSQFILEEGEDALDPNVLPFFGENEEKPVSENVLKNLQEVQEQMGHEKEERDDTSSTVPPKRAISSDQILKLCKQYYDLCCKFC